MGEPATENAGFGSSSRTSIFDYVGVPHHQRWLNDKKFDGGQLSDEEKELRDFYKRLLNFTIQSSALMANYQEIHHHNRWNTPYYNDQVFSFVRYSATEKLVVVVNFNDTETYGFDLEIPANLISSWELTNGEYMATDQLYMTERMILTVDNGLGRARVTIEPLESFIFRLD